MGAAPPRAPAQDHSAGTPGSECLAIEHHPERKELVLVLGPIDLAAHSSHHAVKQLPVQEGLIPFDMTVNGYRVEAVDRHGRRVPQDVIHHINLLDPTDRELFLPIMRRVLAASHETPPVKVPDLLLGVPLEGGDRFLLLTMLHNPTAESFEGVTVRLVLNYNRSRTTPLYRVYPFHVDVMVPLGSKAFDLPPGRSVRRWDGSPTVAGGIVGMGGHLHAYARRLEFIDLTEDRVLWRYEPDPRPIRRTRCMRRTTRTSSSPRRWTKPRATCTTSRIRTTTASRTTTKETEPPVRCPPPTDQCQVAPTVNSNRLAASPSVPVNTQSRAGVRKKFRPS